MQSAQVYPDQKSFVDATPKDEPAAILASYRAQRGQPGFSLKAFVDAHFTPPVDTPVNPPADQGLREHIAWLWPALTRNSADAPADGSLLSLPKPYVVPGGRFREGYYWDSYFTMLGLQEAGREDLVDDMIENFAFEIDRYGHIPNGNRSYYLSRSQPPFFALMVELVGRHGRRRAYSRAGCRSCARSTRTGCSGADDARRRARPTAHVVRLRRRRAAQSLLGRRATRRATSPSCEDVADRRAGAGPRRRRGLARPARRRRERLGLQLALVRRRPDAGDDPHHRDRAGRPQQPAGRTRARRSPRAARVAATRPASRSSTACAQRRARGHRASICGTRGRLLRRLRLAPAASCATAVTAAMLYPLFVGLAPRERRPRRTLRTAECALLQPGGLATTTVRSGQQWDAPNGWAPLQWIADRRAAPLRPPALAQAIAARWLATRRTRSTAASSKLVEKYVVDDSGAAGGGGEYPLQDGFGWTNGVALAMMALREQDRAKTAPRDTLTACAH